MRVPCVTIDRFRDRIGMPVPRVRTIERGERKFLDRPFVAGRWGLRSTFKYQFPGDNFSAALATLLLATTHMEMEIGHRNPVCEWKHPERVSRLIRSSLFREQPLSPPVSFLYGINRHKVESFFAFAYYSFIRSKNEGSGIRRYSQEYPPRLE